MNDDGTPELVSERTVGGDRTAIPAPIRERAAIGDGDTLHWCWNDGELSVEIVRR